MTDERDYLERTDSIWQKANGEAASLDELADSLRFMDLRNASRRWTSSTLNCQVGKQAVCADIMSFIRCVGRWATSTAR